MILSTNLSYIRSGDCKLFFIMCVSIIVQILYLMIKSKEIMNGNENENENGKDHAQINIDSANSQSQNSAPLTKTLNGALSLATTQPQDLKESINGRIAFFFSVTRNLLHDIPRLHKLLEDADSENTKDALVLVFHLRNCRKKNGGKGERDLWRKCIQWYIDNGKSEIIEKNLSSVVEIGRWDDVLVCPGGYNYMAKQLLDDWDTIKSVQLSKSSFPTISLAAKWAPSACIKTQKSKGKSRLMIEALNRVMSEPKICFREKEYRQMLSALRKHLKVLERTMCDNKWDEIDFNSVSSNAMQLYGKKNISNGKKIIKRRRITVERTPKPGAFLRHCKESFTLWSEGLKMGKNAVGQSVKVNASQLFPHEIVKEAWKMKNSEENLILEAQWKVIEEDVKSRGILSNCLFVTDVSGSMLQVIDDANTTAMDIAISLSLLGSRCSSGSFKNQLVTFSSTPSFFQIPEGNLIGAVNSIHGMESGMSTNLQSVFEMILSHAYIFKISESEMPKTLCIISDMEFDIATKSNDTTNYQEIKQKYADAGFKLPTICFWNVASNSNHFPVVANDAGTILLSGFSSSILSLIMSHGVSSEINPWIIVQQILESDTYKSIVV